MNEDIADNVENDEDSAAEGQEQETMIPKRRLDEKAAEIRLLKEQVRLQQEALEVTKRFAAPQIPEPVEEEIEGFDPSVVKGLNKLFDRRIASERAGFRQAIGQLATQNEEQALIIEHGKDAKKYIPLIRQKRMEYAHRNIPLDAETAYKMIRFDEFEASQRRQALKAKTAPVVQEDDDSENFAPPPTNPQKRPAKAFSEMTPEEMEAQLDERLRNSPI